MYRTLADLRNSIDQLIAEQGEHAGCAAFVFTKNDVAFDEYDEDGYVTGALNTLDNEASNSVLYGVGECDWVYEKIGEMIEDEMQPYIAKVRETALAAS
jgi:hypothetical protein